MEGLILAGMGRYEEALTMADGAIATARRMGRGDNVVTNYSTMTLRDIFWLDEALGRSSLVADRLGPSDFNMPWMNARADVICADLLLGASTPSNARGPPPGTTHWRARDGSAG